MYNNDGTVILDYLNKFKNIKFLTRDEQFSISRDLKTIEGQIVKTASKYSVFLLQLLKFEVTIRNNKDSILKFSKNLSEKSSEKKKKQYLTHFSNLFRAIKKEDKEEALKILLEINLSSNDIHNIISKIQIINTEMQSFEKTKKTTMKSLKLVEYKNYLLMVKACQDNNEMLKAWSAFLNIPVSQIKSRLSLGSKYEDLLIKYNITASQAIEIPELCKTVMTLHKKVESKKEILILTHLPLVFSIAKNMRYYGVDFEDLIQAGNEGLMKAIDKYDPERGVKVTTFATWWIRQKIQREIANHSKNIRVPINVQYDSKKVFKYIEDYYEKFNLNPADETIAEELDLSLRVVKLIRQDNTLEVGIDEIYSNGLSYSEVIPDPKAESLDAQLELDETRKIVDQALNKLNNPMHKKIIMLRYGIGCVTPYERSEIVNKTEMSSQNVHKILKKITGLV